MSFYSKTSNLILSIVETPVRTVEVGLLKTGLEVILQVHPAIA
jgi:hypothetical protein